MKQTAAHSTAGFNLRLLLITPDTWLSFINMSQRNFPIDVYRNTGFFNTKILIKILMNKSTKQWFLKANSHSRHVLPFMEPKVSLPLSQQPVNGPNLKPVTSSAHPHTINYLPIYPCASQFFSHLDFPTEILYAFLIPSMQPTWPAHHIRLDLVNVTMFDEEANYDARHINLYTLLLRSDPFPQFPNIVLSTF